jgi:L-lactate dehydrogenase (cytochrome)
VRGWKARRLQAIDHAYSIDELRRLARKALPRVCFDFIEGGAEDELTVALNRRAFERMTLRPRHLVDVDARDQRTVVCGTELSTPVLLGPVGMPRIVSRNADVDAARAAGSAGTVYVVPTGSTVPLEDVAAAATGPLWFQLYLWKSQAVYEELVQRAGQHGYNALVITVDVPVSSKRERDLRNGFTLPLHLSLADRAEALRHPKWIREYLTGPEITFANLAGLGRSDKAEALSDMVNRELNNPGATWDDLSRLRDLWRGPLLVKGTLTEEDARRAVAAGVDGIIVSNHGGRQLDTAPATLAVLEEVVAAAGPGVDCLLDGGIRRGSDVIKAVALGAKAVLIGRPYMWGLAAGGEPGARRAIEILRHEIDLCLTLIGRRSLAELDPSVVRRTVVESVLG